MEGQQVQLWACFGLVEALLWVPGDPNDKNSNSNCKNNNDSKSNNSSNKNINNHHDNHANNNDHRSWNQGLAPLVEPMGMFSQCLDLF